MSVDLSAVKLGEIVALGGVVVALVGFLAGLHQYRVAQKWKRSEFAATLIERFTENAKLRDCCLFLDYAIRTMPVPEDYRPFAPEERFVHNWQEMAAAMQPEEQAGAFNWQQTMYRDYFDHFFDYLERVNHYLRIDLFDITDVQYLAYWVKQIDKPRFADSPIFADFITAYGYEGVRELADRFHKANL